ncbi:MAG: prepilin-type N-terminal cleavage/methylation domain-containing protein [Actinomycetota bacterium]|nr:prepilin-type N-terminal cleavage/methylation domain-containing protein [Actinomycetota bacterium]
MSGLTRRLRARRDEGGFTLIELLVSILLLSVLGGVFMSTVLGSNRSATASKLQHDINEDARLAINRMARELRQATAITAVRNADGPGYSATAITAVTFSADFDGDGCINGVAPTPLPSPAPTCNAANLASNPEVLTYCYDPALPSASATGQKLLLIPGTLSVPGCNQPGALPILAANVTSFALSYRSNLYLYDTNGDGVTSWTELDQAAPPVGDSDDNINTGELPKVDSVLISVALLEGGHQQSYRTQVALRNVS